MADSAERNAVPSGIADLGGEHPGLGCLGGVERRLGGGKAGSDVVG